MLAQLELRFPRRRFLTAVVEPDIPDGWMEYILLSKREWCHVTFVLSWETMSVVGDFKLKFKTAASFSCTNWQLPRIAISDIVDILEKVGEVAFI